MSKTRDKGEKKTRDKASLSLKEKRKAKREKRTSRAE